VSVASLTLALRCAAIETSLLSLMNVLTSIDELILAVPKKPEEATNAMPAAADEPRSDHRLLEATLAGDEGAFAELVRRYRKQITNYIYRVTNDYETAVDLSQETFLRVFRAAERYQTDYAFSTYIYRIATNLAISELRLRKRRRLVSLTGFFLRREQTGEPAEFDPVDHLPLQDSTLVAGERRAAITRAINTLPEKYRVPLVLRDVEERSYEEIAQILRMSEGTVKSRISRARGFLREKLQQYL